MREGFGDRRQRKKGTNWKLAKDVKLKFGRKDAQWIAREVGNRMNVRVSKTDGEGQLKI